MGLWQNFDDEHDILIVSIAIKQQKYRLSKELQDRLAFGTGGLAKEAALMYQLNISYDPNIIHLRGFEYVTMKSEKLWRFFFGWAHCDPSTICAYCKPTTVSGIPRSRRILVVRLSWLSKGSLLWYNLTSHPKMPSVRRRLTSRITLLSRLADFGLAL